VIADVQNSACGHKEAGSAAGKGVNLSDLKGMDSIKAFDVMISRGFASVDTITSTNTLYGIYYNRSTKQCIQVTNADNKVYAVNDIKSHPKCR
jgi:hypothetical protein